MFCHVRICCYNIKYSFLKKEFWFKKSPQFFNIKFQLLTYGIDALFLMYSIISIPLYIFYHIFGNLGLFLDKKQIEANPSLKEEYLSNYKINDTCLFWNLFNNFIPVGLIILSSSLTKVQTYAYFAIYLGLQKLFILSLLKIIINLF